MTDGDDNIFVTVDRAKTILNDPTSDQLSRDLAHIRLQHHREKRSHKEFVSPSKFNPSYKSIPDEWLTIEAYERGLTEFDSSFEAVALVEDALLRNKCKAVSAIPGPDGKMSVILAYPRLVTATQEGIDDGNKETRASANAVMACLVRANDPPASLPYFKAAIKLRPRDWRLRDAYASALMNSEKTSLALEALTQASSLSEEGSQERFDIETSRGKTFFNLGRFDEAKESFLYVLADEKRADKLHDLDKGHLIVAEYMLCSIYAMEKNKKLSKQTWTRAEAKRNALKDDVRGRIAWDARLLSQTLMGSLDPSLLSQQECHHCRKLCTDPKRCSRCKVALYCSRECQTAAWKAGHKKQCVAAAAQRKDEKRERKMADERQEAVMRSLPLDAKLDPNQLWSKAKKFASTDGAKAKEDAVFYFCVALFLDFSLDGGDLTPARAAVEACEMIPLSRALGMITHMNRANPLRHLEKHFNEALGFLQRKYESDPFQESGFQDDSIVESIEQLQHRDAFGLAMCHVFRARIMARVFTVTSSQQAHDENYKKAYDMILDLSNSVQTILPPQRWLTLQFELGYTNLDVGAVNEAKHWLQKFVANIDSLGKSGGKLSPHWKAFRKKANNKLQMAQQLQVAQRAGILPT